MAGVPIRNFNPKYIDSDLDTIRSDAVRAKIKDVLQRSKEFEKKPTFLGLDNIQYFSIKWYSIFKSLFVLDCKQRSKSTEFLSFKTRSELQKENQEKLRELNSKSNQFLASNSKSTRELASERLVHLFCFILLWLFISSQSMS